MIQITQKGISTAKDININALQEEFAENQCIILPNLIEEKLLLKILQNLETSTFYENKHFGTQNEVFAIDQSIQSNNIALHQINFLFNNNILFNLVEQITACEPIKGFSARIYRNLPDSGHSLDWHDDTNQKDRLIAISMNLSSNKYEGGVFQIREKGSDELLKEVYCGNSGDAHLFKVSTQLEHRVTRTLGKFPRTAAAGWFMSVPAPSPILK